MRGSTARDRHFQVGAASFRKVTGHTDDDVYVCPICARGFLHEALESDPPRLTLEHVPPQAVDKPRSAAPMCLTCAQCNSTGGHALDAELARREALYRFALNEDGKFKGRVTVAGVEAAATVWSQPGRVHVCVVPAANGQHTLAGVDQGMSALARGRAGEPPITIGFPAYRHREANVALLRAAFLAAFSALGYRYALSSGTEMVRQQILDTGHEHIDGFALLDVGLARDIRQVCFAKDLDGSWFPVVLIGINAVVLPGIGDSAPDFYSALRARASDGTLRLDLKPLGWPPTIRFELDKLD